MNQSDGVKRFLWWCAIVAIISIGFTVELHFNKEYFARSGVVVIVIALVWFNGKTYKAQKAVQALNTLEKVYGREGRSDITDENRKEAEHLETESDRWVNLEITTVIIGTLVWGFGDPIMDLLRAYSSIT